MDFLVFGTFIGAAVSSFVMFGPCYYFDGGVFLSRDCYNFDRHQCVRLGDDINLTIALLALLFLKPDLQAWCVRVAAAALPATSTGLGVGPEQAPVASAHIYLKAALLRLRRASDGGRVLPLSMTASE